MNIASGPVSSGREPTRQERVAASRAVLKQARDRDDLRLLLDALGLNTKPGKEA